MFVSGDIVFKKVYIEITNSCNLNCDFCIGTKENKRFLTEDEFLIILDKLKGYTKYLYFHILGEPLMHPKINEFIELAYESGFYVNITTNGFLINRLISDKVRQINISLHSIEDSKLIDKYMNNIFRVADKYDNTIVSYRMWINNPNKDLFLNRINKHYGTEFKKFDNVKIKNNKYLGSFHEFIWPDLDNEYYNENGSCYALKDHIGILSNGNIVPCCLDTKGTIKLGNIFEDDLEDILNSNRVIKMQEGFKCKKKIEELCKHCSFLQ